MAPSITPTTKPQNPFLGLPRDLFEQEVVSRLDTKNQIQLLSTSKSLRHYPFTESRTALTQAVLTGEGHRLPSLDAKTYAKLANLDEIYLDCLVENPKNASKEFVQWVLDMMLMGAHLREKSLLNEKIGLPINLALKLMEFNHSIPAQWSPNRLTYSQCRKLFDWGHHGRITRLFGQFFIEDSDYERLVKDKDLFPLVVSEAAIGYRAYFEPRRLTQLVDPKYFQDRSYCEKVLPFYPEWLNCVSLDLKRDLSFLHKVLDRSPDCLKSYLVMERDLDIHFDPVSLLQNLIDKRPDKIRFFLEQLSPHALFKLISNHPATLPYLDQERLARITPELLEAPLSEKTKQMRSWLHQIWGDAIIPANQRLEWLTAVAAKESSTPFITRSLEELTLALKLNMRKLRVLVSSSQESNAMNLLLEHSKNFSHLTDLMNAYSSIPGKPDLTFEKFRDLVKKDPRILCLQDWSYLVSKVDKSPTCEFEVPLFIGSMRGHFEEYLGFTRIHVPHIFMTDQEVTKKMFRAGFLLTSVPKTLNKSLEFFTQTLPLDPYTIRFLSPDLKKDFARLIARLPSKEAKQKAIEKAIHHLPRQRFGEHFEKASWFQAGVWQADESEGLFFSLWPKDKKQNPILAAEACERYPENTQYISKDLALKKGFWEPFYDRLNPKYIGQMLLLKNLVSEDKRSYLKLKQIDHDITKVLSDRSFVMQALLNHEPLSDQDWARLPPAITSDPYLKNLRQSLFDRVPGRYYQYWLRQVTIHPEAMGRLPGSLRSLNFAVDAIKRQTACFDYLPDPLKANPDVLGTLVLSGKLIPEMTPNIDLGLQKLRQQFIENHFPPYMVFQLDRIRRLSSKMTKEPESFFLARTPSA